MPDETVGSLKTGATLAARYRVDDPLPGAFGERGFVGTDTESGRRVRLLSFPSAAADRLRKALAVAHPHGARLEAVVTREDGSVVVVEQLIGGVALADRLEDSNPRAPVDTVKSALRIADLLASLHAVDSAHGELVPAAVLVEPEGLPEPIVRHLGLEHLPRGYARPERQESDEWDSVDDAWSIAALFYQMLTGLDPPAKGLLPGDPELEAAVPDPSLREVVETYLAQSPENRRPTLGHFKRVLARWYAEHAGEEAVVISTHPQHEPPPLPHGSPPPPAIPNRATRTLSPSLRRRILMVVGGLTLVGLFVGLGAAWTYSAIDKRVARRSALGAEQRPQKQHASTAAAPAVNLGEVPVTASRDSRSKNKLTSCVARFLPEASLGEGAALDWLCTEADGAHGAARLRTLLRSAEPAAGPLPLELGWYWIPAFAMIRSGCCAEPSPLELPKPSPQCPSAVQAISELTRGVTGAESIAEPLDRYTQAVTCEVKAGRARDFGGELGLTEAPKAEDRQAFSGIVKELDEP